MKTEVFRYIVYTADLGSLSKAADKLFMTHSALSTAISKYEGEIGCKIFIRTNKGVSLTKEGEHIVELAKKILQTVDEIGNFTKINNREVFTISSIATLSNNILINAISSFSETFKDKRIITKEMYPHEVVSSLLKEKIDLGISFIEKKNLELFDKKTKTTNLCWEPLYEDTLLLYVHKDNYLCQLKNVYESDLHDMVMISVNHRHEKETINTYDNLIDSDYHMSFTNQESVKKLISENNKAIAYLPQLLTFNDYYVKSGDIIPIRVLDKQEKIIYFAVYDCETIRIGEISDMIHAIEEAFRTICVDCQ